MNMEIKTSFKEVIEQFDEANKLFSYSAQASAMPSFVTQMKNTWTFHSLGNKKTEVTSKAQLSLKNIPGIFMAPFMQWRFKQWGTEFAQDLKTYAETGHISKSKRKALEKIKQIGLT